MPPFFFCAMLCICTIPVFLCFPKTNHQFSIDMSKINLLLQLTTFWRNNHLTDAMARRIFIRGFPFLWAILCICTIGRAPLSSSLQKSKEQWNFEVLKNSKTKLHMFINMYYTTCVSNLKMVYLW